MPQVTVYVRKEDLPTWESIRQKSEFLHNALHTADAYKQLSPDQKRIVKAGLINIQSDGIQANERVAPIYGTIPVDSLSSGVHKPGYPCCYNETKRCKHWQWDGNTQEHINVFTGKRIAVNIGSSMEKHPTGPILAQEKS